MPTALAAMPPKPKTAAISAMTKKTMAALSMMDLVPRSAVCITGANPRVRSAVTRVHVFAVAQPHTRDLGARSERPPRTISCVVAQRANHLARGSWLAHEGGPGGRHMFNPFTMTRDDGLASMGLHARRS